MQPSLDFVCHSRPISPCPTAGPIFRPSQGHLTFLVLADANTVLTHRIPREPHYGILAPGARSSVPVPRCSSVPPTFPQSSLPRRRQASVAGLLGRPGAADGSSPARSNTLSSLTAIRRPPSRLHLTLEPAGGSDGAPVITPKTLNWPETCHASPVAQSPAPWEAFRVFPGRTALLHLEPPRERPSGQLSNNMAWARDPPPLPNVNVTRVLTCYQEEPHPRWPVPCPSRPQQRVLRWSKYSPRIPSFLSSSCVQLEAHLSSRRVQKLCPWCQPACPFLFCFGLTL